MNPDTLSAEQRRLVEQAAPNVNVLARVLAPRIPHASVDELRSAGYEGLVQAALRYDPESGVPFRTFAHYRVRGAMIDAARSASPAIRRRSRALRALEASQALLEQAQRQNAAADAVDPRSLRERVSEAAELVARTTAAVLMTKVAPEDPEEVGDVAQPNAEARLLHSELRSQLRLALDQLTDDDRALVQAIYFRGERMHAVAHALGISVSSVSRRHGKVMARLSAALRGRLR